MSLYNMLFGFNPGCVILLPMLGRKSDEYPRFRDCYLSDDEKHIDVYTRVGGGNRNCGYGEEELYKDENYVETFDDSFDSTYATYRFNPPKKWEKDFQHIVKKEFDQVSGEYIDLIKQFYPSLAESGTIDKIFKKSSKGETT